jgi:cytidylate kinase
MVCHLAADRDVVVEGRDMTTIVFPQAEVKFYLDASLDERAHRRYLERRDRGEPVTLEAVKADIQKRDEMDKNKPGGALRRAAGAIYIDSTKLSPAEVVNFMLDKVKHYRAKIRKTV